MIKKSRKADIEAFKKDMASAIDNIPNKYHPLVWFSGGMPNIGEDVYIGGFTEIYAKGAPVTIGDHCDIASFVVINVADSHLKTIGMSNEVERLPITIENNVFIGTMSAILGNTFIGHHSVIGAGVVLKGVNIPPYSLVYREENGGLVIKEGYYKLSYGS